MTGSLHGRRVAKLLTLASTLLALGLAREAHAGQCCAPKSGADAKGASAQCAAGSCVVLDISGMTCKDCAPRVQKALVGVKGVKTAKVSYAQREATVELTKPAPKPSQLLKAVRKAGFDARVKAESPEPPAKAVSSGNPGNS